MNPYKDYFDVVVELYRNHNEPSTADIRVRPVAGQGLSTDMHVKCSKTMREKHKNDVGAKLMLQCRLTDRQGGTPFLYSPYNWEYQVMTDEEAEAFIYRRYGPNNNI